jgi:LCP family protein required for cell wall assembly
VVATSATLMPPRASARTASPSPSSPRRGRLGRTLQRAIGFGIGAAVGAGLLGWLWPPSDRDLGPSEQQLSDLALPPNRPVTVLVLGLDSDRLPAALSNGGTASGSSTGTTSGGSAGGAQGPVNADAVLLLRVNPSGLVQVLQIPATVAVQLPGQRRPEALGALYRQGGVALSRDAVRELVGLSGSEPDRYLVLSRSGLRALVDAIGSVEASPGRTMRYEDRAQQLSIDLQSGLQRLSGRQVEHLVRWRDPQNPLDSRLENQREALRSLRQELQLSSSRLDWNGLLRGLQTEVATNLSRHEALSLLVAALGPDSRLSFTSLPLEPPSSDAAVQATGLRERARELADPFWPAEDNPLPQGQRSR